MATLRVLIVEDDATDAELVVRELKKSGFEPASRRVDTRDAFLIAPEESTPDVIILRPQPAAFQFVRGAGAHPTTRPGDSVHHRLLCHRR